jgi:hypothetical protein
MGSHAHGHSSLSPALSTTSSSKMSLPLCLYQCDTVHTIPGFHHLEGGALALESPPSPTWGGICKATVRKCRKTNLLPFLLQYLQAVNVSGDSNAIFIRWERLCHLSGFVDSYWNGKTDGGKCMQVFGFWFITPPTEASWSLQNELVAGALIEDKIGMDSMYSAKA